MTTTSRLKIPMVEETSTMSPELWNNGYQQIDHVCVAFSDLGTKSITFPESEKEIILDIVDTEQYKFIEIVPKNPENKEEWLAIARSSLRAYFGNEEPKKLHIVYEGIRPTTQLNINIYGWY